MNFLFILVVAVLLIIFVWKQKGNKRTGKLGKVGITTLIMILTLFGSLYFEDYIWYPSQTWLGGMGISPKVFFGLLILLGAGYVAWWWWKHE